MSTIAYTDKHGQEHVKINGRWFYRREQSPRYSADQGYSWYMNSKSAAFAEDSYRNGTHAMRYWGTDPLSWAILYTDAQCALAGAYDVGDGYDTLTNARALFGAHSMFAGQLDAPSANVVNPWAVDGGAL